MKKCPFCAEQIQDDAIKCRHCGELLTVPSVNSKEEARQQKSRASLPLMFWIAALLGTGVLGQVAFQCFAAGGTSIGLKAMLAAGIFAILSPVVWGIADFLRRYAAPSLYFGTSFWDMIGKRFFWTYGPQLIALGGMAYVSLAYIDNLKKAADVAQASSTTMPTASNSVGSQQTATASLPDIASAAKPSQINSEQLGGDANAKQQDEHLSGSDLQSLLATSSPPIVNIIKAAEISDWTAVDSQVRNILSGSALPRGDRDTAKLDNKAGLSALKANDYNTAISSFSAGVAADQNDVEARNNLAYAYMLTGKLDAASRQLAQVLAIAPDRASAWANLSEIFARLGSEAQSVACLRVTARFSKDRDKLTSFLNKVSASDPTMQYQQAARQVLAEVKDIPARSPGDFEVSTATPPVAINEASGATQAANEPAAVPQSVPQSQQFGMQAHTWYYCPTAKAYYPYVNSCPSGWQAVPAQAANPR